MCPFRRWFFCVSLAWGVSVFAAAEDTKPFLSLIFGDHMVLQRNRANTFWGWTQPGQKIRVTVAAQSAESVAAADGRWEVRVNPPASGTHCTVIVEGVQHVELKDVIVGDVWLCGGQSNMQFGLPGVTDGPREVAAADYKDIRLFTVDTRSAYGPVDTLSGSWKICSPQSVSEREGFSAVAYFFARRMQRETGVPIGLIQDCLGGTPIESWMSPNSLRTLKDFDRPMAEVERLRVTHAPGYGSYLMHWLDEFDAGSHGLSWGSVDFNDQTWKPVQLTDAFEKSGLGEVPAIMWFRREIKLPDPLPPGDATLHLGVVEKMDTTFVNGKWVGASSWVENPRAYRVAANSLNPGRNLIAIRVFKLKSQLGFLSEPAKINLTLGDGSKIPLEGEWRGAVSLDARPPHRLPLGYENYPTMPSVLYSGMIEPVAPLSLAGVLWYQGEANANRAHQYRTLLPLMIADWRAAFAQSDLPFYIVQLPAFQARKDQPGSDDWAELREAQELTARATAHSGLVVTIDTGEADNIHPKNKQPIGERLALLALQNQKSPKESSELAPHFLAAKREGSKLRVSFEPLESGLEVHGDTLAEFSVADVDRTWHWADAKLDGNTVVVSSSEVAAPVAVRYAWQANPRATLFNHAGIPVAPFRSDDWPGVTDDRPPW